MTLRLADAVGGLMVDGEFIYESPGDTEDAAIALIEWYNIREEDLDDEDLVKLTKIAATGDFRFWHCPSCAAFVYEGGDAVESSGLGWGEFQGVCENDRTSYPGDGHNDLRCNSCRCWNRGGKSIPIVD